MRKRLKFKNYLNEAKLLKIGLPQVAQLQRRYDYVEWRQKVNQFWRKAVRESPQIFAQDTELQAYLVTEKEDEDDDKESKESGSESRENVEKYQNKTLHLQDDGLEDEISKSEVVIQGITFTMIKDNKGEVFAEKLSRKKVDLNDMRVLIEEMISKGFYEEEEQSSSSQSEDKFVIKTPTCQD